MKVLTREQFQERIKIQVGSADSQRERIKRTQSLIDEILLDGEVALRNLTLQFDGICPEQFRVSQESIYEAKANMTKNEIQAIDQAFMNIAAFHKPQVGQREYSIKNQTGLQCSKVERPIESVGLYIPGGSAPLVSSVLMQGVPASLAGCKRVVLCTPPSQKDEINQAILYAAELCGIEEVYAIGGIQAITAMAFGIGDIPKVDKIFGPGNQWVNLAKQLVSRMPGGPAIDLPAGPSEVLVIADDNARTDFIAADLLSQAEHDPEARCFLITNSRRISIEIEGEIEAQLQSLSRKEIASQALESSCVILVEKLEEAFELSNRIGPEHLLLQVSDPQSYLKLVKNAGSVFCGSYTPEAAGDYASGTNHVLPTAGAARAYSGLSVSDFTKTISIQTISKEGLRTLAPTIETLARMEGLDAHARAVSIRLETKNQSVKD